MFIGIKIGIDSFRSSGADVYGVLGFKPELVIDAVEDYYRANSAATTFADMVTFSRASGATYTDSSGVLQTAASGVARTAHHIYNGASWVKAGLLVEPTAATNLITHAEAFENAFWTESNIATISAGSVTSPAGTDTAETIAASAGAGAHSVYTTSAITATTGTNYCLSFYVKKTNHRYVYVSQSGGTTNFITAVFDLDGVTGEATQTGVGAGSGTIVKTNQQNVGGGWYRLSISGSVTAATRFASIGFAQAATGNTINNPGNVEYTAAGTETVSIWGAQLEAGSVPSSYIPTAGSTATRAAETVTVAAAKVPYSATAMSIQMEGYFTYADLGAAAQFVPLRWYLDANNFITIDVDTDSTATGEINFNQSASGTVDTVASSATAYAPGVNVAFNIASRHGATFINGAVDGTALTEDATPTALPALSSTNLALGYSGGPIIISKFRMWGTDLGDAGIEEASA